MYVKLNKVLSLWIIIQRWYEWDREMRIICTWYGLGKGKNSPPFYYFPFFMHLSAERQGVEFFNWGMQLGEKGSKIGKMTKFSNVYWCKLWFCSQDLPTHSRFVSCHTLGQVHSDWVRRVKYIPAKEFVISCSGSGKDSLVVRDIDDKKRKTYTFKVAKVNTMP